MRHGSPKICCVAIGDRSFDRTCAANNLKKLERVTLHISLIVLSIRIIVWNGTMFNLLAEKNAETYLIFIRVYFYTRHFPFGSYPTISLLTVDMGNLLQAFRICCFSRAYSYIY